MKNTNSVVPHVAWCDEHDKKGFTKKNAKKVTRMLQGKHETGMREYPCGLRWGLWHVGHLPQATLEGRLTASEVYGRPDAA